MKKILTVVVYLFAYAFTTSAQTAKILNKQETKDLIEETGAPTIPLLRAYEYQDKGGVYNVLLCEDQKKITGKDTLHTKLEAASYLNDHGGWIDQWKISDHINTTLKEDTGDKEVTIAFWTKYCSMTDIDMDKTIDPVIVYGTRTEDGTVKQIKIFIIYKNKKYAIRAVESDLDYGRSFKKDPSFQALPVKIQTFSNALLERIRKEQGVLLKNG